MKCSLKAFTLALIIPYSFSANAVTYTDNFSTDLSKWTAGTSHLDNFGIIDGELFLDGYGHLTGPGGWGVLQFNQQLGRSFVATWDAKITVYDYSNFVLFADSPWEFSGNGEPKNGYAVWLDIDDSVNPLMDAIKRVSESTTDLASPQRDIALSSDISNDEWHSWKVEVDSGNLQVSINDILYIDTFDSTFSNSDFKIGLSFGEDSEGFIDNFQVTTSPVPVPTAVWLFSSGLIGLIGMKRKSSKLSA